MQHLRRPLALVLLLALALAAGLAAVPGRAEETPPPPLVELGEVFRDPLAYLGRSIRFRFQLREERTHWNPYLTRFGPSDYRAVSAWSDEQFLWRQDDWEQPLATLFVLRDSVAEQVLEGAPRLARYEAVARVEQVFLGRPWISVRTLRRIHGEIGEGSILHASRALQLMQDERWPLALENFERASLGEMPDAARAELRRLREACERREQL